MQISLTHREVESLDLSPGDRLRLTTRNGSAWVTLEGIADDFVLTSACPLEFSGPGRLVIESIDSDITVRCEFLELPARGNILLPTG